MTIREIANATGKTERTVSRWVGKTVKEKLGDKESLIKDKMSKSSPMYPADFDLEETLAIIKTGLGTNAAELFRANAMQSMSAKKEVDYEVIGKMIGMAVTAALAPVVQELKSIKKQPLQIEQPKQDYYSLLGYCAYNNIELTFSESKKMGMDLRRMTLHKGLEIRKIPDERYGRVNSYPVEVLDEYFAV